MTARSNEEGSNREECPSKRGRGPKRNPLLWYLVILFAVAFLLLLLSYFMQMRNNAETINGLKDTSISAVQTLDNLIASRDKLLAQVDELEDQHKQLEEENAALEEALSQATAQGETLERQVQALDYLRRIQSFYTSGSYRSARMVIEAFQAAGLEDALPTEGAYQNDSGSVPSPADEYKAIYDALY